MASYTQTTLDRLQVRETQPDQPLIFDDWSLAFRLGCRGKTLWYLLKNPDAQYKVFKIRKASGGFRTIHSPSKPIKFVLDRVRYVVLRPLTAALGRHVTAYQVGLSTKDAAQQHIGACEVCAKHEVHTCLSSVEDDGEKYAVMYTRNGCLGCQTPPKHTCSRTGIKIHMDLCDFFGSTRRSWIREYFHKRVGYNHYASSLLASLMTVKLDKGYGVPQGAPTSGDICNLVADVRLDTPLLEKLAGTGWVYTRYADDLYFSHPSNQKRVEVASTIKEIESVIAASGYRVNKKKLHVQSPTRRQQVLGIVVNQKINISSDEYRRLRNIVHRCYYHGFDAQCATVKKATGGELKTWLVGKLTYMNTIAPKKAKQLREILDLAIIKHPTSPPPEGES